MRNIFVNILIVFVFLSCNSRSNYPVAENALDAAREYVDGTLKGEFKKSETYLLPTEANKQHLEKVKKNYYKFNDVQRQDYRGASIIIEKEITVLPDKSVIYFQNSFDKQKDSIVVVNNQGEWKVTFE